MDIVVAITLFVLALLIAILLLMSMTPLGYLNIGPLAITLNVVPLAVAAVALWAFDTLASLGVQTLIDLV